MFQGPLVEYRVNNLFIGVANVPTYRVSLNSAFCISLYAASTVPEKNIKPLIPEVIFPYLGCEI